MSTSDIVAVQVLANAMRTIANEVETALVRAAYSPVIKESFDCSAAVISPSGEYWAQADAIPGQLGVLSVATLGLVEKYGKPLRAGDILLSNDPYLGCPHLNDFVSVAPVVKDGTLLAYVSTLAHYTDIGGKTPGSMPADATEIYQEGLRLPPRLLFSGGRIVDEVVDLLLANTRTPDYLRGDLSAQVAASKLGLRRISELVAELGGDTVRERMADYFDYTERLASVQFEAFRPGSYTASRFVDNPELDSAAEPSQVIADVTVHNGRIKVDFSRSGDQVARPINCVVANTISATLVAVRCMLDRDVPINGGLQRLFEVTAREGCLLNPRLPAPVGARAIVANLAFTTVVDCLGQAAPSRAAASSSGGSTMPYTWMPDGSARILIDNSLRGGTGASVRRPGMAAIDSAPTNATNYPVEVLEQEYPVRVEHNEIRRGSGGAGRHPGGDGMRRGVRFLEPGVLSIRGHAHQFPPRGSGGGEDGQPARFWLVRGEDRVPLPPQASGVPTRAGDTFIAETPGGGGFGPVPTPEGKKEEA